MSETRLTFTLYSPIEGASVDVDIIITDDSINLAARNLPDDMEQFFYAIRAEDQDDTNGEPVLREYQFIGEEQIGDSDVVCSLTRPPPVVLTEDER